MAAPIHKLTSQIILLTSRVSRCVLQRHPQNAVSTSNGPLASGKSFWRPLLIGVGGSVVGVCILNRSLPSHSHVVDAHEAHEGQGEHHHHHHQEAKDKKGVMNEFSDFSRRQKRFHDFASCELKGEVVMTPYDFVESLVENSPKLTRRAKIHLTSNDVERIVKKTPPLEQGSHTFFRNLHQDGIITYPEYLFLVTVLTKSTLGLRTALKMIDANDDKQITVEEFQKIERMISRKAACDTCHIKEKDGQEVK